MIRSLETAFDGGKVLGGYGWFTGTATSGWMMKIYGTDACSTGVSVSAGYNTVIIGIATSTTCLTTTAWLYSARISTDTTNNINRSNLVTDAVEEWKNGGTLGTAGTAAGHDVLYFAVGGINRNATFGLGLWNMMIWATNKSGLACVTAKCSGTTWTEATATGYSGNEINRMR